MFRIWGAIFTLALFNVFEALASDRCDTKIDSWVYQLQQSDPQQIGASGFSLAVVDYARDGSGKTEFTSVDVSHMKKRHDGRERLVLAYLSIGEAEDYRYYWDNEWKKNLPGWLLSENEEWNGNYPVRFWCSDWQNIIFGSPDAYLDKIIAAGFDGVYLDRIDVYWEIKEKRMSAQADMVAFVQRLSKYAKSLRPGFLIVPQNAEGLLEVPEYMATIDGIAKESLHYLPGEGGGRPPAEEHEYSYGVLKQAVDAGKFILTVDYVSKYSQIEDVYTSGRASGFVPHVTVRALDEFTVNDGLDPKAR